MHPSPAPTQNNYKPESETSPPTSQAFSLGAYPGQSPKFIVPSKWHHAGHSGGTGVSESGQTPTLPTAVVNASCLQKEVVYVEEGHSEPIV